MKYITSLVLLMLMIGCKAQSDVYETVNVPPERLYAFNQKSDALIVVMHSTFEDGCAIILSIDGVPAAHIISGEKANLGVAIGSHKLSAR
uniref:hypothetical protein n=1 Tax=Pseudomonas sp. TWR3-1-1 TaxID=2804633 RepID=UPI003CE719B7